MMARGLASLLVRVAAILVPAGRRGEWRREWLAELAHAARRTPGRRLVWRALLSVGDAVALRRDGGVAIARRPGGRDGLLADLRFGIRAVRRSPGFAIVALATFGLGIGVNATVFGAVDAVLFRPLPFARPSTLVQVVVEPGASASKATLTALRERTRTFEGLAGWSRWGFTWTGDGSARLVTGVSSTADLFRLLEARPAAGRLLEEGDDAPGAARVAVASYGFWQTQLGGERGAIGRTLTLNGVAHTLVGVTPRGFAFPDGSADLFVPVTLDPSDGSDWTAGYLILLGRTRESTSPETVQEDVRAALAALAADAGGATEFGANAQVENLRDALVGAARAPLLALLSAVGFVLLVACANLANVMLARTTGRHAELAVRRALGATRGRIARQLLVETAVLAVPGGLLGLLAASIGLGFVGALLPATLPNAGTVALDARVVGATLLATAVAAVAAGLVPSLRAAADAAVQVPGERSGTASGAILRLQAGLLASQIALAVLLIACAGLALRTVHELLHRDTGYRPAGVLTVIAVPPPGRYGDEARLLAYWQETLVAVRAMPGVSAAGAVHIAPFGGSDWNPELVVEDRPVAPDERLPETGWRVVTPGWFDAAGVALLQGRVFDDRDREGGAGVAIVNQTLARRFWPDGSAIGRRVRTFFEDGEWVEIVGVVTDTRDVELDRAARPQLYRPHTQYPTSSMMLALRSDAAGPALAASLRSTLEAVDDEVLLVELLPFEDRIAGSVAREQLVTRLLAAFAILALALGAIGTYGVATHAVGRRRRELGVRAALGARRSDLLALILRQTARPAIPGALAGLVLAAAATHLAAARIPNLLPPGPVLLGASAMTLLAVALLAAWVPARRAARIDPQRTLREE